MPPQCRFDAVKWRMRSSARPTTGRAAAADECVSTDADRRRGDAGVRRPTFCPMDWPPDIVEPGDGSPPPHTGTAAAVRRYAPGTASAAAVTSRHSHRYPAPSLRLG